MTNNRVVLVAVLAAILLSACVGMGQKSDSSQTSNKQLASGIKIYEDGDYPAALVALNDAEDMGLRDKHDQVLVHKYLAFIHCVSGREKQCHEEFREALELDPTFDLTPAEAGHPIWGPVFRVEKAKFTK